MLKRAQRRSVPIGLATIGVLWPAIAATGADDIATVRFNNQSWGNPNNWLHTNSAANGTVPNNSREFTYDVVVQRTVDLDLDVTVEKGLLDGGQISDAVASPNTLRFNDLFTFRNGFLQPNTTAAGGILFDNPTGNPFIERASLTNLGVSTWTGGSVSPIAGGGLTNAAGAMFYVRAASNLQYFSNDLSGHWNNHAPAIKLGPARWDVRANFFNFPTGQLDVDEGEVRLLSGGWSAGRFDLAAGTTLTISGSTYILRNNARVEGQGLMQIGTNARLEVNEDGQPVAQAYVEALHVAGILNVLASSRLYILREKVFEDGELQGAGEGEVIIEPQARMRMTFDDGPTAIRNLTINNRGETTIEGGGSVSLALQNGARLRNAPGGLFQIDAPATLITTTLADRGSIVNHGTMELKTTPQGNTVDVFDVEIENRGFFEIEQNLEMRMATDFFQLGGKLEVKRDAAVHLLNAFVRVLGGELCGEGEIDNVQVGTQPGSTARVSPGQTPGKLTIRGTLTMGDNAELFVELGGRTQITQYDLLDVIGNAALDGDLLIDLIDGFEFSIQPSDVFTVMTADSPLTGAFDNVANGGRVTGVDGFATFQVNYGPGSPFDPNSVVLSNVALIPEPAAGFVTCVAAALLKRRRR